MMTQTNILYNTKIHFSLNISNSGVFFKKKIAFLSNDRKAGH